MNVSPVIMEVIREVASESDKQLDASFGDQSVLLDSGLDSLDFAIIVARLEERFGDDPFAAMADPVYPRTLGDFVTIYESHFSASS